MLISNLLSDFTYNHQNIVKNNKTTLRKFTSSNFNIVTTLLFSDGLTESERKNIVDALCEALEVRFEDTRTGLIQATSVANFKVWPMEENDLEGLHTGYIRCGNP